MYDDNDDGDLPRRPEDDEDDEEGAQFVPRIGPAEDPYEDRPEARREALAPLLDPTPGALAASPLRFLRGTGDEKLDLVLSLPDPARAVQAMAPEEFVLLVKDVGLGDAADLLALASPRQLQACLDLDAWGNGELEPEAVGPWIQAALEAGDDVLERFAASQEEGLWTLYLSASFQAFATADGPDIELPDDMEIFASPDGTLQLVCDPDDPSLPEMRALMAALFRSSVARGRMVLFGLRWELPSQLAEDLFALRAARLEDMGFLSRDEAREVYGYRDPHAFREQLRKAWRGTAEPMPGALRPYLADADDGGDVRLGLALRDAIPGEFLPRAVAQAPVAEQPRLRLALTRLAYRIQAARASRPSAVDELAVWSRHALRTCSMGLEHASDGDLAFAALLLQVEAVSEFFRCGHSLVLMEHQRARRLRTALAAFAGETGGDAGLERLEPTDAGLVQAMTQRFPGLAVAPDAEEVDVDQGEFHRESDAVAAVRPLESLAELADVRRRLQGLAAVVRWMAGLRMLAGDSTPPPAPDARLSTLLNTAIAQQLLTGEASLQPLGEAELRALLRLAFVGPGFSPALAGRARAVQPDLRRKLTAAILVQPDLDEAEVAALTAFVEGALDRMAEELGGLDPEGFLDLRFVGSSVLIREG